MDILFATTKLEKSLNTDKTLVKEHGERRAKKLKILLTRLRAAPNLAIFAPPYSPPDRCHELGNNLKGLLSLDLDDPYRLLFRPAHEPVPTRSEGGLDWQSVTAIEIVRIENTHD